MTVDLYELVPSPLTGAVVNVSLSQMCLRVLLSRRAGAMCPVSTGHFPGEGGAAGLRPLPWKRWPRTGRGEKHLVLRRYVTVKFHGT